MAFLDAAGPGLAGFTQGLQQALTAVAARDELSARSEHLKQQTQLLKAQETIILDKQRRLGKLAQAMMQGPATTTPAGTPFSAELGAPEMGGPASAAGTLQAPITSPGVTRENLMGLFAGAAPEEMAKHYIESQFSKPQGLTAVGRGGLYDPRTGQVIPPASEESGPVTPPVAGPNERLVERFDKYGKPAGWTKEPLPPKPEKTAQPYTPEISYLRAVQDPDALEYKPEFESWQPGTYPSAKHQNAAKQYQARMEGIKTKERVGGGLEAQADRIQLISNIAEAKTIGGLTDQVIRQRTKQATAIEQAKNALVGTKEYNATLGRMKAQLTEAEPGTSYVAALEEARTSGKPLTGQAAGDVVRFNQYLRASNLLRTEFSDAEILKYVGLGRYQAKQLEQFMRTDPRFMRFMVLNEQLRGTAFGEGGKQLTPFEASVVFGYTPTGREAWGEYYLAKLEEIGPRYRSLMEETLGAARQGRGKYTPSQMPPKPEGTVSPGTAPQTPVTKTLGGKTYISLGGGRWKEQ